MSTKRVSDEMVRIYEEGNPFSDYLEGLGKYSKISQKFLPHTVNSS
jgi:hypothetical protein